MVHLLVFSTTLTKRDNFYDSFCLPGLLFASLVSEACQKKVLLLNERICSNRSKFFLFRGDPNVKGGNENGRVASPDSVPFQWEKNLSFKGLLHCFSTCIGITGNNWYYFILKNVENCKEKFQRVKKL